MSAVDSVVGTHLHAALACEHHRFADTQKLAHLTGRGLFAVPDPDSHLLAGCPYPPGSAPAPNSLPLPRFQDHLALDNSAPPGAPRYN